MALRGAPVEFRRTRGDQVKRLIAASMALLALAFGAGTATAASSGGAVEEIPAAFSLSSTETNGFPTGCEFLPDGVVITWEGTEHSVSLEKLEPSGAVTLQNTTTASGTATDEDGNAYAFSYANHFKITETAPGSGLFTGTMTDHFSLAGNHINLNNGFTATFTTNFDDVFAIEPSRSYGSPLDFATGLPECDPL
jgi:hypothetical protein